MEELIVKALELAGYAVQPTVENLRQCFLDYVDSGVWHNLDLQQAQDEIAHGEIGVKQMAKALIRYCKGG